MPHITIWYAVGSGAPLPGLAGALKVSIAKAESIIRAEDAQIESCMFVSYHVYLHFVVVYLFVHFCWSIQLLLLLVIPYIHHYQALTTVIPGVSCWSCDMIQ